MTTQDQVKLHPHDKIMKRVIIPLIPKKVKPNHVTVLRFLLTPLILWLIIAENYLWGIPIFLLVAFTDTIDGSLARVRNQITDWGKLYDPLADKMLIGSIVLIIVFKYLSFFLGLVIIIIEAFFIIGAFYWHKKGVIVQADIWGKMKMLLQVVGVLFLLVALLLDVQTFFSISAGTFYMAIIFAIISLFTHGV